MASAGIQVVGQWRAAYQTPGSAQLLHETGPDVTASSLVSPGGGAGEAGDGRSWHSDVAEWSADECVPLGELGLTHA